MAESPTTELSGPDGASTRKVNTSTMRRAISQARLRRIGSTGRKIAHPMITPIAATMSATRIPVWFTSIAIPKLNEMSGIAIARRIRERRRTTRITVGKRR